MSGNNFVADDTFWVNRVNKEFWNLQPEKILTKQQAYEDVSSKPLQFIPTLTSGTMYQNDAAIQKHYEMVQQQQENSAANRLRLQNERIAKAMKERIKQINLAKKNNMTVD
jgi:hypothetical protein